MLLPQLPGKLLILLPAAAAAAAVADGVDLLRAEKSNSGRSPANGTPAARVLRRDSDCGEGGHVSDEAAAAAAAAAAAEIRDGGNDGQLTPADAVGRSATDEGGPADGSAG